MSVSHQTRVSKAEQSDHRVPGLDVGVVLLSAFTGRFAGGCAARFTYMNGCLKLGIAKAPRDVALWVVPSSADDCDDVIRFY